MKSQTIYSILSTILFCFVLLTGCKLRFSFNPGSLPADIKTITIDQFDNSAKIIVPTLSQDFTEKVRDVFLSQTRFQLLTRNGDLHLHGEITRYDIAPVAIQGGDQAAQNRLTISVKVFMDCDKYEDLVWTKTLSNFANYDATASLSAIEASLIEDINDKLAQDIFNQTFQNW